MKYLTAQKLVKAVESFSFAAVDIRKVLSDTGYFLKENKVKFPKPRFDDAQFRELGNETKIQVPVDFKFIGDDGNWDCGVIYLDFYEDGKIKANF